MDPNSAVLGQKELPGLCEHHRKHSPPASALSRCHGNQPFKTRQVASNSSLVQKALLLVRGTVFRFQHFPFLSKLNDVEIFGAGKPRLSGLSPIPVDGMDYICHLCPRIDFFFPPVSICHPLYVLGQKLNFGIAERQAAGAALALLEEAAQTKRAAEFRLRVQAVKVFPGQQETLRSEMQGKVYIPRSSLVCFVLMPVACPFLPAYLILVLF